jgi:hypothetical protein
MNREYYARIYLNSNPTPLDMSLLDTDEALWSLEGFEQKRVTSGSNFLNVKSENASDVLLWESILEEGLFNKANKEAWLKITSKIKFHDGLWNSYLHCELKSGELIKNRKIRLSNPLSKTGELNNYEFFVKIPETYSKGSSIRVYLNFLSKYVGTVEEINVVSFSK